MTSSSVEAGATGPSEEPEPRPRRGNRRVVVIVVGLGVLAAAVAVILADPFASKPKPAAVDSGAPTAVATVTRERLSARTQVGGTLTYAGNYSIVNQAKGTYTKLPRTRKVYHSGNVLYKVDGNPVIFMEGAATPAYRDLAKGTEGPDAQQLNSNLVALGYATSAQLNPRSDKVSDATVYALKRLQRHLGIARTGKLALGQAVFLPTNKIRINKINATLGATAQPGVAVLQGDSNTRKVTVALTVGSTTVKVGDRVTITLPDGKTTPGEVSGVGTVAKKASGGSSTVNVSIRPTNSNATGKLDQAPVTVSILTASVDNVLVVPVNALLALAGGGYALEVIDSAGARHLERVTLGLFDDEAGKVQVSGPGVTAGQRIVVPAS
jgi:hypothetical protein